jgi:hypothetical protein
MFRVALSGMCFGNAAGDPPAAELVAVDLLLVGDPPTTKPTRNRRQQRPEWPPVLASICRRRNGPMNEIPIPTTQIARNLPAVVV